MQVSEAARVCLEYHRTNSKKNTIKAYEMILSKFCGQFGDRDLYDITTDDAMSFLNQIPEGKKKMTRKIRYSHLKAFFNFVKNSRIMLQLLLGFPNREKRALPDGPLGLRPKF